jgi:hypothetical protein
MRFLPDKWKNGDCTLNVIGARVSSKNFCFDLQIEDIKKKFMFQLKEVVCILIVYYYTSLIRRFIIR